MSAELQARYDALLATDPEGADRLRSRFFLTTAALMIEGYEHGFISRDTDVLEACIQRVRWYLDGVSIAEGGRRFDELLQLDQPPPG